MQNVNSGKHSAYNKLFNEKHMYILLSYQHTQPISQSFGRVPELHLPRCPSLIFSLSLDFRNTLSGNKSWLELNPSRRLPPVFIAHTSVITAPRLGAGLHTIVTLSAAFTGLQNVWESRNLTYFLPELDNQT